MEKFFAQSDLTCPVCGIEIPTGCPFFTDDEDIECQDCHENRMEDLDRELIGDEYGYNF